MFNIILLNFYKPQLGLLSTKVFLWSKYMFKREKILFWASVYIFPASEPASADVNGLP